MNTNQIHKNKLRLLNFTICLFFFVISINAIWASSYHVYTTGNDVAGDGSNTNPWATINKGISKLNIGDTLFVHTGVYQERVLVPGTLNGTELNPIAIIENPGDSVIICHTQAQIVRIKGSYINFIGFEIYDLNPANDDIQAVTISNTANHVLLDNLDVHDFDGHGINIAGQNIIVQNCKVHNGVLGNLNGDSTSGWESGIKVSAGGENILVRNNTVYDNWGEGIGITRGINIKVYGNIVYDNFSVNIYIDNSTNVEVFNNFSYNTENPIVGEKASGISLGEEFYTGWGNHLENVRIKNNIVYNTRRAFMSYATENGIGGAKNVLVANNTFYLTDNDHSAVYISRDPKDSLMFYNNIIRTNPSNQKMVWWDNYINDGKLYFDYNYWVNGKARFWQNGNWNYSPAGSNDISEISPEFLGTPGIQPFNFSPNIFELNNNSPAINAGISIIEVAYDFNDSIRPNGAKYDLGAFEHFILLTNITTVKNSFSIYPNPTTDRLFVELDTKIINKTIIKIYDISGKLMFESRTLSKSNIIDVSKLEKGMYLIKISTKDNSKTFKIIKE